MLQLDGLRGAPNPDYVAGNTTALQQPTPQPEDLLSFPSRPQPTAAGVTGHGVGSMIHWGTAFHQQHQQQQQQQQQSTRNNSEEEDEDEYRPFTPPPPRERLSYTRYQLELLNGIYQEVRYPNSTQKQLIAKRVGITREQVKIWFQNRRRKDVVTSKQPASKDIKDEATSGGSPSVSSPAQPSSNENSHQMDETKGSNSQSNSNNNNKTNITSTSNDGDKNQCSDSGPSAVGGTRNNCSPDFENTGSQASNDSINSCGVGNDSSRLPSSGQISEPSTSTTAVSSSQMTMVSPVVLRSMITELNKFDNEYLKLKKGKKKKSKSKATKHLTPLASSSLASSSLTQCKAQRLFQSYDMVAPPNKVTPSAFLNTSANRFKHAGGTSAFQNPRDSRVPAIGSMTANESRFWEGFGIGAAAPLPGTIDSSDLLQQRSPSDALQSPTHQSPFGSFLSNSTVTGSHTVSNPQSPLYDNIPVLTDLLGSYKNHPSSPGATAVAAAAVAQRQLEHSLLSQAGQPPSVHPSSLFPFHTGSTGSSSSNSTTSEKSPSCDLPFPSPPSHHPFTLHPHHPSPFPLNRVFPFPLIADPPMMLSSIRQAETYRQAQWPHPPSPLSSQPPPPAPHGSSLAGHNPSITPNIDDPYRPLVISSLSNPYFSPSTPAYTFPSSTLPPPPPLWTTQPGGSTNPSTFTDM